VPPSVASWLGDVTITDDQQRSPTITNGENTARAHSGDEMGTSAGGIEGFLSTIAYPCNFTGKPGREICGGARPAQRLWIFHVDCQEGLEARYLPWSRPQLFKNWQDSYCSVLPRFEHSHGTLSALLRTVGEHSSPESA